MLGRARDLPWLRYEFKDVLFLLLHFKTLKCNYSQIFQVGFESLSTRSLLIFRPCSYILHLEVLFFCLKCMI